MYSVLVSKKTKRPFSWKADVFLLVRFPAKRIDGARLFFWSIGDPHNETDIIAIIPDVITDRGGAYGANMEALLDRSLVLLIPGIHSGIAGTRRDFKITRTRKIPSSPYCRNRRRL